MEEKNTFFSATKEKIYITAGFLAVRLLLGYLNRINIAAKLPFFVNMIFAAIDLIISLPMKLVFATPALKIVARSELLLALLFAIMIAYWYLFACTLVYAYNVLNAKDETNAKHEKENKPSDKPAEEQKEVQSKLG